jgi:ceramide glucosyltransferase
VNILVGFHIAVSGINLLCLYVMLIILLLYQTRIYAKKFLQRYSRSYNPSVSIFVPCKGTSPYFEKNISKFLQLNYSEFTIYFIVESREDPAYNILKRMTNNFCNAELVVAGLAEKCGQKNYNILAGIDASGRNSEVYIFMDSDIAPSTEWLKELIRPLSNHKITVSTGFRWLLLHKRTAGEYLHAFMNAFLLMVITFFPVDAVWGGSMAIRRKDFEDLGVEDLWAHTVVDDITLEKLVLKNRKRAIHVPTCIAETDDIIPSVRMAVSWFKRQTMFSKLYIPHLWITGVLLMFYAMLQVLLLPLLIVLNVTTEVPHLEIVIFHVAIYDFLIFLWASLIKKPGRDNHNRLLWFIRAPFNLVMGSFASLLSLGSKKIEWSGITYHVNRKGTVQKIIRENTHNKEERKEAASTNPLDHSILSR